MLAQLDVASSPEAGAEDNQRRAGRGLVALLGRPLPPTAAVVRYSPGAVRPACTTSAARHPPPPTAALPRCCPGSASPRISARLCVLWPPDVDTQAKGEEVFAFLEEQEEPVMEKDIRKGVGGNTRLIPAALRALVEKGEIERTGEGKKNKPYRYNSRFLVSSIYKKRENEKNHNPQPISD